ncbi:hypothetical protein N7520_007473 [Penicillium odoratum]|uniref:uncharacterized protein n=1 Tax=Penicillium odoratum TaxID=1167516 RepID=UPI00254786DC|nr:uncharacterized protein N7520_007473 [Penicillium odoratum]KAJ5760317.1 hypothetical protein N7520_007473 [Penicillium odoratum]
MDTAVSNLPLAMGQGERQGIHPFFQQEFTVPEKPIVPNVSSNPVEMSSDQLTLASVPSQQPEGERQGKLPTSSNLSNSSKERQDPSSPSPEDDPNAGRRKRRKIDKTKMAEQEASLQAGLSGWLGKDIPASVGPPVPTLNSGTIGLPTPGWESTRNQATSEVTTSTDLVATNNTYDLNRKTLKLNPNGRLLSSPPPNPHGTSDQTRKAPKRGRPRKTPSKLVVIKYTLEQERNVGQLINDILSGKHVFRVPAVLPKSAAPPNINANKPTHPFFSKKPPQKKTGNIIQSTPKADLQAPLKSNIPSTREQKSFAASCSPFGRPKPKFPEPIHPLWPPQDLFHIKYTTPLSNISIFAPNYCQNDYKKAKLPSIGVKDDENALLVSTALARKSAQKSLSENPDHRPTLRLPGRYNASGKVLQRAIDSQMSWSLPNQRPTAVSPSISKLRSNLLNSFSAFDSGKYETHLWSQKYAPKSAEDVLQVGREPQVLRDWLRHLKITAVDTGKTSQESKKSKTKRENKKKKRQKAEKLDGFIVSSEEEASEMDNLPGSDDELAGDVTVSAQRTVVRSGDMGLCSQHGADKGQLVNAILLSGPSGCGKTASVYAVAKELDFEVFEINPGTRRSARDMLEKVGDMTQNHLVHLLNEGDESSVKARNAATDEPKQNKLNGFFKGNPLKPAQTTDERATPTNNPENDSKRPREQKQSLILLEEADILFDEDRQFWTGVFTLISQSRRPIIITCNDESLVPIQDMSLHAILRYQRPPPDLVLDYLLLVAANEGHALKRDSVSKLYNGAGHDIRRALMDLNFWCQIGVGSEKAGLDWILPFWPPEKNVDKDGDRLRVLSLNTYESYMGWFNRDLFLTESPLERETEALRNSSHWWRLNLQELEDVSGFNHAELLSSDEFASKSKLEQLELLSHEAEYSEMRSSLDILCSGCPFDVAKDILDVSSPPMLESHRSNYVDAHPLLQSDLLPEYSSLSENISMTSAALISRTFRPTDDDIESVYTTRISNGWGQLAARRQIYPSTKPGFQKVFGPIMRARHNTSTGRLAPSFEHGLSTITEDLAPYIRGIMVFDCRLKVYRDNLHAVWAQEQGQGEVRARTTRASRAALEGSDKAFTRRERWFPEDTNYFSVQGTGKSDWQQALFQMGYFHVQPAVQVANDGDHERSAGI